LLQKGPLALQVLPVTNCYFAILHVMCLLYVPKGTSLKTFQVCRWVFQSSA